MYLTTSLNNVPVAAAAAVAGDALLDVIGHRGGFARCFVDQQRVPGLVLCGGGGGGVAR